MTRATIAGLPSGAEVRIADERASITIDVTGLSANAADQREAQARQAAAAAGYSDVRVARTAERVRRRLIAIASGKGGVGKSTLAANLAAALARQGRSIGLIDADIHGPSQPVLFGTVGQQPQAAESRMIPVPTAAGVGLLSMGMLVPSGQAVAWRGPMAANALGQMVDAHWGTADPILVDLPPGTGDVQLTMVQKHRPAGAIVVCTPQDLALIDAERAIDFFVKASVPVIGLVENMAGYACPHCGGHSEPFGSGGVEAQAGRLDVPFIGRIPLDPAIRAASDIGAPPAAGNAPQAAAFVAVAEQLEMWLRQNGG